MDEPKEERTFPVTRLNFPLAVVVLVVSSAVSVAVSQVATSASIRGEISGLRTEVAVMNTRQEERANFYREAIGALREEGLKQKTELQSQMRALEYVIKEIQIALAKREAREGG